MWGYVGPLVIQRYSLMNVLLSTIYDFQGCFKQNKQINKTLIQARGEESIIHSFMGGFNEPDLELGHIISDNLPLAGLNHISNISTGEIGKGRLVMFLRRI